MTPDSTAVDAAIVKIASDLGPDMALFGIIVLKLVALTIGYKIVRLGYDALIAGIKGDFTVGGRYKNDTELKLVSTSPGLFFVLLGVGLIAWVIFVEKKVNPATVTYTTSTTINPQDKPVPVQF